MLAISGLHISLLGMGLYRLLRKRLHTRYVTAALATTVFLISYAVLSGNGVSTQRAVGMCLIYLFADVTGYAYDMLNALGIVVLVLLWENPFLLSYSGFVFFRDGGDCHRSGSQYTAGMGTFMETQTAGRRGNHQKKHFSQDKKKEFW